MDEVEGKRNIYKNIAYFWNQEDSRNFLKEKFNITPFWDSKECFRCAQHTNLEISLIPCEPLTYGDDIHGGYHILCRICLKDLKQKDLNKEDPYWVWLVEGWKKRSRHLPDKKRIVDFWESEHGHSIMLSRLGCEWAGTIYRGRCFACGIDEHVDRAHINARSQGNSDHAENLHMLCNSCHQDSEYLYEDIYWTWFKNKYKRDYREPFQILKDYVELLEVDMKDIFRAAAQDDFGLALEQAYSEATSEQIYRLIKEVLPKLSEILKSIPPEDMENTLEEMIELMDTRVFTAPTP